MLLFWLFHLTFSCLELYEVSVRPVLWPVEVPLNGTQHFFFFVFIDIITKPIPMNHRIMEYPNLGGTHKDYQVQLLKGVGGNPYGLLGGQFMT